MCKRFVVKQTKNSQNIIKPNLIDFTLLSKLFLINSFSYLIQNRYARNKIEYYLFEFNLEHKSL